jgi:hypothetical protein
MGMYWTGDAGCIASGRGPSPDCACDACRRWTEEQRQIDAIPCGRLALGLLALGAYLKSRNER